MNILARVSWGRFIVAMLAVLAVAAATSASASAYSNGLRCNNLSSGDVCWINYYTAYPIAYSDSVTQFQRDQVCAKARSQITTGPVSTGSACTNGYIESVYYTYPSDPKKAYGYWSGNGGAIYIDVSGRT